MNLDPEEARRLHVLTLLESGRTTPAQAAEVLGLTQPSAPNGVAQGGGGRTFLLNRPDRKEKGRRVSHTLHPFG